MPKPQGVFEAMSRGNITAGPSQEVFFQRRRGVFCISGDQLPPLMTRLPGKELDQEILTIFAYTYNFKVLSAVSHVTE